MHPRKREAENEISQVLKIEPFQGRKGKERSSQNSLYERRKKHNEKIKEFWRKEKEQRVKHWLVDPRRHNGNFFQNKFRLSQTSVSKKQPRVTMNFLKISN